MRFFPLHMYNPYGSSGYRPTHHFGHKSPEKGPKFSLQNLKVGILKNDKVRKILILLGLVLGFIFVAIWLALGDFRFMMWRYASLSGFPFGTRDYIVLFQNNYELRPTGGFVSTYGVLHFSHGFYAGIDFQDVYGTIDDHEYIEPPLILSTLLEDENYMGHTFRDANFDPDFTISKDELIKFYQMTNPDAEVDGVIAADFTFLEWLVGRYEPMNIEGYELTQQNLFETLSTVVSDIDRHNEEELANRKNITSPLVQSVITKTIILPWRIFGMLDLIEKGFQEKHVLAAFERSGIASSFAKRGWDGAMPQSDAGDFLAVNEGNYGGMKSDRYITRDVQYEIDVTGGKDVLGNPVVNATVQVTISHEGIWNIPLSGRYTGYLRTMIPLGSRIIQGSSITEDRQDSTVLGELVELDPGQSATYIYAYELPEYVWVNGTYHLHLHKQPGTVADNYRVIVRTPQGTTLDANGFDVRENIAFFETQLATDTNLSFSVVEDANPPHIVSHEITDTNQITVVFNEAVGVDYAGDPLNYSIVDTDYADASTTDTVSISSIRVDGAAVIITTTGMTPQLDERYEVTMRGIQDTKGNIIDPNPRTVTVVQDSQDEFTASEEEANIDSEPVVEEPPEQAPAEESDLKTL